MSNDIINQPAGQEGENADVQDPANTQDAATKNAPVEAKAETPQTGVKNAEQTSQNESETAVAEPPAAEKKEPFAPPPQTPHDDFDWSVDKRNVTSYNKEEKEKYDHVYESTFKQINDGEMIHGIVVGANQN